MGRAARSPQWLHELPIAMPSANERPHTQVLGDGMIKRFPMILVALASAFPAFAASFDVVTERKSGDWSAILYRNQSSGREFCALEANAGGTVFRISRYKDNAADTFLEVHNPSWDLIEGKSKFTVDVVIKGEFFRAELMGTRYADAYVHDFTENRSYLSLLGMIALTSSLEVKNPNGTQVFKTSGNGSNAALTDFGSCTKAGT